MDHPDSFECIFETTVVRLSLAHSTIFLFCTDRPFWQNKTLPSSAIPSRDITSLPETMRKMPKKKYIIRCWCLISTAWLSLSTMAIPSNAGRSLSSEEKTASKVEGPRRSARDSSRIQLRGLGEQKGRYDRSYVYDEILQDPGENIQIVQFPLSNQLGQRRHSSNKNEGGGERDEEQVLAVAPSCKPFVLDFQRAADGRLLPGMFKKRLVDLVGDCHNSYSV
jgi:hypothetical protein